MTPIEMLKSEKQKMIRQIERHKNQGSDQFYLCYLKGRRDELTNIISKISETHD